MGIRLVLFPLILFFTQFAFAQTSVGTASNSICDLEVSFIKGSKETTQQDSFSEEIFNQLKHLPFNSFKLLNKEKSKIEAGKKIDFKFYDDKYSVIFMPTNLTSNKVQAMLEWVEHSESDSQENSQTNLISTKMWFEKNKSIVFGSQNGKKCKIINVNINCK